MQLYVIPRLGAHPDLRWQQKCSRCQHPFASIYAILHSWSYPMAKVYPPPRLIRCCRGGAGIVKRKKRGIEYIGCVLSEGGRGKQDLEKYSCLYARKQKHTKSVRSVRIKDGAYRNGTCWQLRVCLHGWCLLVVVCAYVDGTCQQLCVLTWLMPAGGCVHVYNIGTYWRMCAYECLLNRGLTSCLGNVSFRVMLSFSMSKHPSQHSWIKPNVNIQVEGR